MDDLKTLQLRELQNIEQQIRELENGPWVKLARQYDQIREKRLTYLQELKRLDRFGRKLHELGWDGEEDEDAEAEEST